MTADATTFILPTATFDVRGMHCDACASRLAGALRSVPGVRDAHVTLSPPTAQVQTSEPVPLESLAAAARAAGGYTLIPAAAAPTSAAPAASPTAADPADDAAARPSLYPLVLIIAYIAGAAALTTFARGNTGSWPTFLNDFMAGFFLVFSFFKLLDLRGFADAYRSYDLIAARLRAWAFAYPFIELALGIAFLLRWQPTTTNVVTLVLMLIGSAGVLRALLDKRRIRCACLGTALNLPMTTVTLVEDLGMAAMAAGMLVWGR